MTLFVIVMFVPILVLILLLVNILLAPKMPDSEKISVYESGFEPVGNARSQFSVSFYLVALLFLIFDLELAMFYPLLTTLNIISSYGFLVGIMFISILSLGFVYEFSSGVISFRRNSLFLFFMQIHLDLFKKNRYSLRNIVARKYSKY